MKVKYRQLYSNDCGIASIKNLLFLNKISFNNDLFKCNKNGISTYSIKKYLLNYFKKVDIISFDINQLKKVKPYISLIKINEIGHYVVVYKKTKQHLYILDSLYERSYKIKYEDFKKIDGNVSILVDDKSDILIKDNKMDIFAEFKPYSVVDETNDLLKLGDVRIFLTGTLGSKDKFCEWNNINPDETYYIYQKSPFDVKNRPIYTDFVGSMSGKRRNIPRWRNEKALSKVRELLDRHPGQKGVVHTSSNEQAHWIMENLKEYNFMFVGGSDRNEVLKQFSESDESIILIGASLKDGVDFKMICADSRLFSRFLILN